MRLTTRTAIALLGLTACLASEAANDRFFKEKPGSMNGFLAATDATYVKECGSCHFPYSPGLLPTRSWDLHMARMERHFGEQMSLPPQTAQAIHKYLLDNAADKSPFEGSQVVMERIDPQRTPFRFWDVPVFREMHRVMAEVIDRKPKVKVRTLTNCNACHQGADSGSFGLEELLIPGLTVQRKPGSVR